MIVTCLGHAKFLLELDNGLRIVTDPYDDQSGYPVTPVNADVVLVSHGHHDHNADPKFRLALLMGENGGCPRHPPFCIRPERAGRLQAMTVRRNP